MSPKNKMLTDVATKLTNSGYQVVLCIVVMQLHYVISNYITTMKICKQASKPHVIDLLETTPKPPPPPLVIRTSLRVCNHNPQEIKFC
jgi:hypothetical protein